MFGYIICNKTQLTKEDAERYQSLYCGLCRVLMEKYGQMSRFCLSYDMTFLILLLSSLYEPEEMRREIRCAVHPIHRRTIVDHAIVEYAADMSILLMYFQCMDDWTDEKNVLRYQYAKYLEPYLEEIRNAYPRQFSRVQTKTQEIAALEKKTGNLSDQITRCSGELVSELFVYKEDYWSGTLRMFGYELGRFIYLMDAVIDYEKDRKTGSFNLFIRMHLNLEHAEDVMKMMIGNAMEQFDRLPIIQDEHILKNILYDGVWTQYRASRNRKEKSDGSVSSAGCTGRCQQRRNQESI